MFGNRLALPAKYDNQPLEPKTQADPLVFFEGRHVRKVALGTTFGAALIDRQIFFWGAYHASGSWRGLTPQAIENIGGKFCSVTPTATEGARDDAVTPDDA